MQQIEVRYYHDLEQFHRVGSIVFDDIDSPSRNVRFIGFLDTLVVGDEVVIPSVGLGKGSSILVQFHSTAFEVRGSCSVGDNKFVFPKRSGDVTWYLKFVAKTAGRVRPYVTFQRMKRSKLKITSLICAALAAVAGAGAVLIPAVQTINTTGGGISAAAGLALLAVVPVAWSKLEPLTKQWEDFQTDSKVPRKRDNWVKMFPKEDVEICEEHNVQRQIDR